MEDKHKIRGFLAVKPLRGGGGLNPHIHKEKHVFFNQSKNWSKTGKKDQKSRPLKKTLFFIVKNKKKKSYIYFWVY